MSWRCPRCRNHNADSDTSCSDCGYCHESIPIPAGGVKAGQSEANPPQGSVSQGKWVIVCPDCGREIVVESKDAELEECPECGNDSIETVPAYFKEEDRPVRADEQPMLHPRMFIQEIRAIPETSNKFIYHQKGRTPEFISDKIEILPPEKKFGRNDLPKQGEYYKTISEEHCKFRCDDNGDWFISDLGSTNGTRVDDERLIGEREKKLTRDSEIQMGKRLFAVFIE